SIAIPSPVKNNEKTIQSDWVIQVCGVMISPIINNQVSIPIPVTTDVMSAKNSGRFRSIKAFPIIMENPTTTSQLPKDNPNVRNNPTSNASKGEVPSCD